MDWLSEDIELPTRGYYPESGLDELLGTESVALVWEHRQQGPNAQVRPLIVIEDDSVRDFIAWASVYVSSFAPFSAFFRVLSRTEFLQRATLRDDQTLDYSLLNGLAGVVVAEAIVQMGSAPRTLSGLSVQACQGTFSYAALCALNAGVHPADFSDLAESWYRARRIGSDAHLRLSPDDASFFWMIVCHVLSTSDWSAGGDDTWMNALHDLITVARYDRPVESSRAWTFIRREVPTISPRALDFSLPREQQLTHLDEAAHALGTSAVPQPFAEAWLGMLASRLANGSFDYAAVLDNVRDKLPGSLLWFALFSMWRPGFDGLVVGNCLGRRIAREAAEATNLFDVPRCDASLLEYEILSGSNDLGRLRSDTSTVVSLEIRPFVVAKFKAPTRGGRSENPESATLNIPRLRKVLMEALEAIDPEPKGGGQYSPRSPDLFDSGQRRSTKSRKRN